MQTRARRQRLEREAQRVRRVGVVPTAWSNIDIGLLTYIIEQGRLSRGEAIRLGGVSASWRQSLWGATTSLSVIARMDGLPQPGDETGLLPWLASRLSASPRLRSLRVCCGYDKVAAVMAAAAAHAPRLDTLELSFYVGDGQQAPLPAAALQGLSRLRSLRALALGTGSDTPQPHITRLTALKQLTRLEMPYLQASPGAMTPPAIAALAGALTRVEKAWLDCPGPDAWDGARLRAARLRDLRVDLRPDAAGIAGVGPGILQCLPTALVALQVSGAHFFLSDVPFRRLPHLTELAVHDRVLEEASPDDVAPVAGQLRHLGIFSSSVGFVETPEDGDGAVALDEPLDAWTWLPALRALTAVTQLSFNSFVGDNRNALPCVYACALGLQDRVRHLHLFNLSREDDAADVLALAARRWARSLERLTLHCCEGVTAGALRAMAAAAGPGLVHVELRCCPGVSQADARAAAAGLPAGGAARVTYLVADWWSDG